MTESSEKSEASETERDRSGHAPIAVVGEIEGDEVGEGEDWRKVGYSCSSVAILWEI